jgi:hypothetical protein
MRLKLEPVLDLLIKICTVAGVVSAVRWITFQDISTVGRGGDHPIVYALDAGILIDMIGLIWFVRMSLRNVRLARMWLLFCLLGSFAGLWALFSVNDVIRSS